MDEQVHFAVLRGHHPELAAVIPRMRCTYYAQPADEDL